MDYLTKSSGIIPNTELNLCENTAADAAATLEASLKTDSAKRHILVQAYLHSDRMILLTVENIFDGNITAKNGEYQSSKRSGCGIGLQSVRHIAEKSGGYSRFLYENGTFCATSYCGQRNNLLIPPISVIIPSRYPIMAMQPFHKVYLPGTPLWPFDRFTRYTFQVPHYGHAAVSQGIPSRYPVMAIRPFHKVYLPGTPLWPFGR